MRAFVRSPFVSAVLGGAVVAVAFLAFGVGGRDEATTTTVLEQRPLAGDGAAPALTPHDVYQRDAPGVVFVRARRTATSEAPSDQRQLQQGEATGTGFVVDADGHILTNEHVVGDARVVEVEFSDDRTVRAEVLGDDPTNDLALLRVDPSDADLHPLTLGDSSTARVGDPVVAIGNPFGLDRTLTTGVVSALQRQLRARNGFTIQHVIQTDAPINPGNSGGPLIDAAGRVIGITSQIATGGSGGSVGIGFAVPINTAKRLLPELKRSGTVAHAYLGITGMTIDGTLADVQLRVDRGVLVQTVYRDSPADRGGVRGGTVESQIGGNRIQLGGDVITSLDGATVRSMEQLSSEIADRRPGETIALGILRGGRALVVEVTLGTAPKQVPRTPATP